MSDFWGLSDGEDAKATGTSFETGGGAMPLIPDGSSVLATIDDVKWDETQDGYEYLNVRWSVAKPEQFTNRKVFHKLWVTDDKPKQNDPEKTRDKAKRMLAAIDANAGGKLARKASKPTNEDLALALIGKPMVIRVHIWEMDGKSGNWVAAVNDKNHALKVGEAKPSGRQEQRDADDWVSPSRKGGDFDNDLKDEIPF